MKKSYLILAGLLLVCVSYAQDLISGGSNAWILHTPDDGRTSAWLAPMGVSNWDFTKSTEFLNNGNIRTSGRIYAPRLTGNSSGNLIIQGHDIGGGNGYGVEFYAVQNGFDFKTFNGSWETRLLVADNGNVGIGMDNPSYKLHISAPDNQLMRFTSTNGTWLDFESTNASAGNRVWSIGHVGTSNRFGIYQRDGTDQYRFLIDQNGNVGIGTFSPSEKLVVANTNSGVISRFISTSHGGISGLRLQGETNDGSDVRFMDIAYDAETDSYGFGAGSYSGVLPISSGFSKADIFVNGSGNVGIGTTDPKSKLAVDGQVRATEVKVLADISVPDYVFEPDYQLRTIEETEEYIAENKHLPEIPSASEIGENGIDLGDMNMRLLKKIEELTLYLIEQNKEIKDLKEKVAQLESK